MSKIIIIGAGAAGLMAGRELSRAGNEVIILEAGDRCGGRIWDVYDPAFPSPVLLGAEFIHGKLPFTLSLLKEAGIHYYPVEGRSVKMYQGKPIDGQDGDEHWPSLIEKLSLLREDMTLSAFLNNYFGEERYRGFRESVLRFARGFDAADPDKVSALALLKEWKQDEDEQYRVEGGYTSLISFMVSECICYGCDIRLQSVVTRVNWSRDDVEVFTSAGESFTCGKLISTVPVGVLQLEEGISGSIVFNPPLPDRMEKIASIGFGPVIKVVLHFREPFWEKPAGSDTGFIFSEEKFPTWWTQLPRRVPVLTGWLGGPDANIYHDASDEQILKVALQSLSAIFGLSASSLQSELLAWKVCNWADHAFARGAYTYPTIEIPDTTGVFDPIEDTLYFAGEAAYQGPHGGTVEAALVSAMGVLTHNEDEAHSLTYQL